MGKFFNHILKWFNVFHYLFSPKLLTLHHLNSRREVEVASQEKKKSRKEIRRHLKEKVVEKGETNREKLEWIRL